MNHKISIIVPVYNAEEYLKQCLDSLVNQTYQNLEIICINDGSTDGSLVILKDYAKRDPRIVVIDQENQGVSVARNTGLKCVQGEYYMFVDSDDWIELDMCQKMYNLAIDNNADCVMCSYVKEFEDHSVVSQVFPYPFLIWNENEIKNNFHRRLFGPICEELRHPEDGDVLVSCWMQLFRTSKFSDVSFFDIREIGTFEDGLYQIDVYSSCKKFVYECNAFYHYRKNNEMSITTRHKEKLYRQWQYLFKLMQTQIDNNHLSANYQEALNNRICLSMIGLGLNQIKSGKGILSDAKTIKEILQTDDYRKAFDLLKLKWFPIHWKIFFWLCKHQWTLLLLIMLHMIEFLRRRVRK